MQNWGLAYCTKADCIKANGLIEMLEPEHASGIARETIKRFFVG